MLKNWSWTNLTEEPNWKELFLKTCALLKKDNATSILCPCVNPLHCIYILSKTRHFQEILYSQVRKWDSRKESLHTGEGKCPFWTLQGYSDPETISVHNWTMNCSFTACGHDCCNLYFKVKLFSFAWATGEAGMSEAIPKTNRPLSSITLSQDTGFRSLTLYFHLSSYVSLHNEIESISL